MAEHTDETVRQDYERLSMNHPAYYLGCPVWTWPTWRGTIYPQSAPQKRWLHHYSTKFNCVEGNSTFYGIPRPETVARWASETVDGFRFALKFPKSISHDSSLIDAQMETEAFLELLSILKNADRLGPTFLQLSPYFAPRQLPALKQFLMGLPNDFPFAVEVRHAGWFEPTVERELDSLLAELQMDRVIFDSRPLFSAEPTDEYEIKSQNRKPQVPIRKQATGKFPLLRLIGCNQPERVDPWIDEWVEQVSNWIGEGRVPFVFTHAPNDEFAPQIACRFHQALSQKIELPPQPSWETPPAQQLDLF